MDQLGSGMIVVDANVIVYLATGSAVSSDRARAVRQRDAHWVAPPWWRSEFRNALFGYLRRGQMTLAEASIAMVGAELALRTRRVVSDDVLQLAARARASAYDCEYVALARALRVPLVTADRRLAHSFPETCVSLEYFA